MYNHNNGNTSIRIHATLNSKSNKPKRPKSLQPSKLQYALASPWRSVSSVPVEVWDVSDMGK